MDTRRFLRTSAALITTFVVILTSGALGVVPMGIASAHAREVAARPEPPTDDGSSRFTPTIHAPNLPVSAWQAPKSTSHGTVLKNVPSTSAVSSLGQKRAPGEQIDLRTEASTTFLNADGTWTRKQYGVPVHYMDAQGHWQDIDNTLEPDTSDADYAYGNKANHWHVHFAAQAGGSKLLHVQFPTITLAEILDGAASVSAVSSGHRIVYPGVFPDVDLQYSVANTTVEELLLLRNAQVPSSYTFTYHVPGVQAHQDAAGSILFTDATGKTLLKIGGVQMFEADAQGRIQPTGAATQAVAVTLTGNGPDFMVTLTPSHAWLTDPARHFPVAIDPTLSGSDPHTATSDGNIYGDTMDESGNPTWNFDNQLDERIGNCNYPDNTGTNRAYVKFPVNNYRPANVHVTSANLALWQSTDYAGGGKQVNAQEIKVAWDETQLTWNNHPTNLWLKGSANTANAYNLWLNIDVTTAVYDWWQNNSQGLNGFQLQYADEQQQCERFFSDDNSDTAHLPTLTINYVTDTNSPSGTLSLPATYTDGTGNKYTNTSGLTLTPSASDPGATNEWSSNWTTVNGLGTNGFPAAAWSVDGAGSQLTADTSTCGTSQCWAQSWFTHTISNMTNWPTYTAMFKTDAVYNLHFGVISGSNNQTRFTLVAGSSSGFTTVEVSRAAGSYTSYGINIPISANTWYYGQVDFPLSNTGEIYIWPAGQPRPTNPTTAWTNIYMDNPGLNFFHYGDNGANLHHVYIGNVVMTSKDPDGIDVGAPAIPGSTVGSGGTWTVQGAGSDIWNGSDQFQYAAESLPGDGNISAHVTSQTNTNGWAKAGLMLRGSTDPGAPFYAIFATPANGIVVQYRSSQGAAAAWPVTVSGGVPAYLKVARAGTTFTAYTSTDGNNWTLISGSTLTLSGLSGSLLAGLAVTSHNAAALSTVTFDTISLISGTTLPGCSSAWPCLGSGYGVYGMGFSNDGTNWSCPSPAGGTWCIDVSRQTNWMLSTGDGRKTVSYRYVDNAGNVSTASSSQIILDTTPPTTSITGLTTGLEVRGVVPVTASASDPVTGGTSSGLKSVALFADGQQVGAGLAGTNTPAFVWDTTNVTPGAHVLTVQATDNVGNVGTSAGVKVIVSNTGQMPYETFAMRELPAGGHGIGVNVGNGNTLYSHTDLDIPGRGPDLSIHRTYNALAPVCSGLFGCGWTSDLDEGLLANGDGSVTYRDPDGGMHVFLPNGSGGYLTSPALYLTLVKNADSTYTLTAHDQTKTNFNAAGYLTSVVDRNGNTLTIANNTSNVPTIVTDAVGRQMTLTTSGGRITAIAVPGSRTYTYTYDANGNLTDFGESAPNPATLDTHYDYDTSHRLTKVTLDYQSGVAADQQTNVATALTYDTNNRLVKLVDPLNFDVGISYTNPSTSGTGQVTAGQAQVQQLQTAPTGTTPSSTSAVYETTAYTLTTDGADAVTQIANPVNGKVQYQFNSSEQLVQVTDPDGHVATSTYDANGNELQHVTDPGTGHLALTTAWTYDSANNVLTETDPRGIVTQFTYDTPTTGNLTKKVMDYVSGAASTSDTNVTSTYTYDSYGAALTSADPLGVVTQYSYDSQGDVTRTVQNYKSGVAADSQTNVSSSATYDVLGQELTSTNSLGIVSQNTYDILGNVIQTVANYKSGVAGDSQTNVTTRYGYDALGRRVSTTNPRNIVSQTTYDADGRETQTIQNYVSGGPTDDHTNVKATTNYDAAGNATLQTDPKGNTTTTTYDLNNRATEVVAKSSAGTVSNDSQTTYDAASLKLSSTVVDGSNNQTTSYTYDAANRPTTQTDPPATTGGTPNVTTPTYDAGGNQLESKVTNGTTTVSDATSTFDKQSRPLTKTEQANSADAQTTSYAYDLGGRQTSMTDPANKTTTTTYDALGRTLTVNNPDGSQQAMTYDAGGERMTQSNCGGTAGKTGSSTDGYDSVGRVNTEQRRDCAGVLQTTATYAYDVNGNQAQRTITYADGSQYSVAYTYDALDRTATMSDGTRNYTYDANGNVTQMQVLTGTALAVEADNTWDGANRLTGLTAKVGATGSTLHTSSYTYDGKGNRTQVVADGVTTTYGYDGNNQLVSVGTTTTYTYDANHNRTKMVTSAGTTTYTYDTAADVMLQSKTDPSGKVTNYSYDTNGNLTKAVYDATGLNQVTSYTYDTSNRLASVTRPDGTVVAFTYDADGNRVAKAVTSGTTTTTIKDVYQLGHLAYQTDATGATLATFTYDASNVPTSVTVGSGSAAPRYYYVYNGHGDVVNLTDASGTVVASYAYDEFGVLTSSSETLPNGWTNPFRYDGRDGVRYDSETGLSWMAVRAYDPSVGRFISRDPLGRAPLFFADQPYAYAGNNPLVNVDPSGQRRQTLDGGDWTTPAPSPTHTSNWGRHARIHVASGCPLTCKWDKVKKHLSQVYNIIKHAGAALIGIVQLVGDIFQIKKDLALPGGVDKVLDLVGDIISMASDAMSIGAGVLQIASDFGVDVSGFGRVLHTFKAGLNLISAGWKAFRASPSWWIAVAKATFFGVITAAKALLDGVDITALVFAIVVAFIQRINPKWDVKLLFQAGVQLVQGALSANDAWNYWVQSLHPAQGCEIFHC